MSNRKLYYFFFLTILLIGLGIGAFWYYLNYKQSLQRQYKKNDLRTAATLGRQGKFDESIAMFEEATRKIPSNELMNIEARFGLGLNLFFRNLNDDRVKAVDIYKKIIADVSISPPLRALAIGKLLDFYNGTGDKGFAKEVIFAGPPLGQFLENGDIPLAARRAYEFAESLYPISLHEFRIANWYASELLLHKFQTVKDQEALITGLKLWIEKAETNIPAFLNPSYIGYPNYPKSTIGYLYEMEGRNLYALATFSDKNYAPSETAFKRALDILATNDDVHAYNVGLYTRVHYADMLVRVYGENRKTDILNLLQPIITPPLPFRNYSLSFFEEVTNKLRDPQISIFKTKLTRISNLIPEFRQFLETKHGLSNK